MAIYMWMKWLDSQADSVRVFAFDFSKAFDHVNGYPRVSSKEAQPEHGMGGCEKGLSFYQSWMARGDDDNSQVSHLTVHDHQNRCQEAGALDLWSPP